ncbi:glycerol dehydrogenase [Planococcus sp. S3-L1]|uniref:glycerol dehydrogenase n=1 Tax=Planococcus sp. S3-L1 TaxID=3046200 RepID=UPI0024BB34B6|nr:glycerol dehydrogenase [Planococcus sp. S3-L1]MDJ0332693.1 glycerol dehydrogenase [Planococcus sp. S3-L1]
MQKKIFISPKKYIQGAGVLSQLGEEVAKIGETPFVLSDSTVWGITGDTVAESFKASNTSYIYEKFTGEASNTEIDRLSKIGKDKKVDVVIGLGGGKTIDTAKAVGDSLGVAVVVAPTTASTDAPTSALSVIYSDDGVFEGYKFYTKNPDLVLVDSKVIVNAPVFLLASGMGDAMATFVETRASLKRNSNTMAGGKATLAGQAIAEKAEEVLFDQGIAAYRAAKQGLVTPQVEAIIEANTLLSGLGFENGGLASAHAIHNGFTALKGEIHKLTHGQKVAYGVLTQLVLEGYSESDILRYADFFKEIELPTTLKDLHLENASYEDLLKIGELATVAGETSHNMNPELTPEQIADAILAVNAITTA